MILKQTLIDILLSLGFHNWEYSSKKLTEGTTRECRWTGKKQYYVNEGPVSGWGGDFEYWVDTP